MSDSHKAVTELLEAWGQGDEAARDELMTVVYQELHRLAHNYMNGNHPATPYKPPHS